jgi:hypothetical protein
MLHNKALLQESFPFLTVISYLKQEYVGIVQNADNVFLNLYVLSQNFTDDQKKEFLECGEIWWWSSNRTIPINIFLGKRFEPFKPSLKVFVRKECNVLHGPVIDLNNLLNKRIKRRTITLVKSAD